MKRDIALDIAKGIAMLLVIIGHCDYIPYHPIRHFIFTFHVPLFFLVSGYLYKARPPKEAFKRDLRRFGNPYVLTCVVIILISLVYYLFTKDSEPLIRYAAASLWGSGAPHDCKYLSSLPAIGPLWFLPALLICKNVYNILPEKYRLFYSLLIFLVSTIVGRYLIVLPFAALPGLSALAFYAIGDHLKKVKKITYPYWIIGILCWCISFKYSHIYLVLPQLDLYYIDVIGATTASILVYMLCVQIISIRPLGKFLSWVGEYSLIFLCVHSIENDCGIARQLSVTGNTYVVIILSLLIPVIGTLIFTKSPALIQHK